MSRSKKIRLTQSNIVRTKTIVRRRCRLLTTHRKCVFYAGIENIQDRSVATIFDVVAECVDLNKSLKVNLLARLLYAFIQDRLGNSADSKLDDEMRDFFKDKGVCASDVSEIFREIIKENSEKEENEQG